MGDAFNVNCIVPLVIPAYEPDERLLDLLSTLNDDDIDVVVLVNDGSGKQYQDIFIEARRILKDKLVLLSHQENQGKGAALKTAMEYIATNYSHALGIVTADSDGQHNLDSILRVKRALISNNKCLILGVRNFKLDTVPWKSKFGNLLTRCIFKLLAGVEIADTQTGLRGIPSSIFDELLEMEGNRFEYEMQMLMRLAGRVPFFEVEITTIYDSRKNHQTHFHPILDSYKVYRTILSEKIQNRKV